VGEMGLKIEKAVSETKAVFGEEVIGKKKWGLEFRVLGKKT